MKLYVVGSVASGKSTLAERISQKTGIPCRRLDEAVYIADPNEPWGDRKRPTPQREVLFHNILKSEHYIMEDVGRECFTEGMERADTVLLLEPPLRVRRRRILKITTRERTA